MKLLLALSLSLFTSVALACTDFSGNYADDSSGETFQIAQAGCSNITLLNSSESVSYTTDGQARVTQEDSMARITTTASFIGNNLTLNHQVTFLEPIPEGIPPEMLPGRVIIVYTEDAQGNVIEASTLYNIQGGIMQQQAIAYRKI